MSVQEIGERERWGQEEMYASACASACVQVEDKGGGECMEHEKRFFTTHLVPNLLQNRGGLEALTLPPLPAYDEVMMEDASQDSAKRPERSKRDLAPDASAQKRVEQAADKETAGGGGVTLAVAGSVAEATAQKRAEQAADKERGGGGGTFPEFSEGVGLGGETESRPGGEAESGRGVVGLGGGGVTLWKNAAEEDEEGLDEGGLLLGLGGAEAGRGRVKEGGAVWGGVTLFGEGVSRSGGGGAAGIGSGCGYTCFRDKEREEEGVHFQRPIQSRSLQQSLQQGEEEEGMHVQRPIQSHRVIVQAELPGEFASKFIPPPKKEAPST